MTQDDFSVDGIPLPMSTPDEDAWEAYLTSVLEQLGADGSTGVSNKKLAELEAALGCQLPFEVGLLLVMGVPDSDGWQQWGDDPARQLAEWDSRVADGIVFDVQHNEFWLPAWGIRPDSVDSQTVVAKSAVQNAPPILPLYGHRAIPVTRARDVEAAESNPVLSIVQTDIIVYGTDLADWLHNEFDVPLPMWPTTANRWFPFWSEIVEQNER